MSFEPYLHLATFRHYYWSYDDRYKSELHSIFNSVVRPFPLELTYIVVTFLKEMNAADRVAAIALSMTKCQLHDELRSISREVAGVITYSLSADVVTMWSAPVSQRLINALDPATWLSAFAYEALPYAFNLGPRISGLMLSHPRLRERLAEVGVRAVEDLRSYEVVRNLSVRGCEVRIEFCRAVRNYVRVLTCELFRRYGDIVLEDTEGIYDVYLNEFY